jgi:biopolymer transport protein ExbD
MIHSPGPRLQRKQRRPLVAEVSLTSLVDVLVVLVIFCLINFQAGSELP